MSIISDLTARSVKPVMPLLRRVLVEGTVSKSMYNVPKQLIPDSVLRALSPAPKATSYNKNPPPQICYKQAGRFYAIPRYAGIAQFGPPTHDLSSLGEPMRPGVEFTGTLRDYQKAAVDTYVKNLRDKRKRMTGQQMVLSCGLGKTVVAIALACQLQRRTAILVHKDFLLQQWKERILQFAPGAKVGIVRQNRCEVEDCDFTLVMLQSLVTEGKYPRGAFDTVGFLVCDESHHIAARTFVKSLEFFPARYRLSLTATPERGDGLSQIVNWHFGPMTVNITRASACKRTCTRSPNKRGERERESASPTKGTVAVKMRTLKLALPPAKRRWDGTVLLPSVVTSLAQSAERNRAVLQEIRGLLQDPRVNLLVLSDRRAHVQCLVEMVREFSFLRNPLEDVGSYVGVTSKKAKEAREKVAKTARCIVSTYSMASEGLDIKRLNAVVLATPKKNVEQAIGRAMRNPDTQVKIVDFVDAGGEGILWNLAKCRRRLYESKGYTITIR